MTQHATTIAALKRIHGSKATPSRAAQGSALDVQAAFHPQRTVGNRALARYAAQNAIGTTAVQAKMMLGPANDAYEQEADSVASQIMQRMVAPSVQRHNDEEEIQMKPMITPLVQRESEGSEEEEEELQASRAASAHTGPAAVDGDLESQIRSQRGSGSALPDNVRAPLENGFGADFSNVRVHQTSVADTLNRSLQARAFTTGNDIFFRGGEYNPGSQQGQHLLAHELTHVVQQGAAAQSTSAKELDAEDR